MIELKTLKGNLLKGIGLKLGAMLIGIVSLPAYVSYFGSSENLGIWLTILSILNWLMFFDLGFGNAIRNQITTFSSRNELANVKNILKTSYVVVSVYALLLACLVFAIGTVFKLPYIDLFGEHQSLARLLFVVIILLLPFRLIMSALFAIQKSVVANSLPFFTQLAVLIYLVMAPPLNGLSSNDIEYVYAIALLGPLLIATVYYLTKPSSEINIIGGTFTFGHCKVISSSGFNFFLIQVSLLFINSTNEIFIATFYEPDKVVTYQAYYRMYSIFLVLFSTITVPMWSAMNQALAVNNTARFLKLRNYLRMLLISSFVLLIVFQFFTTDILKLWLGKANLDINKSIDWAFVSFIFLNILVNYFSCILNAHNLISIQVKLLLLAVLLKALLLAAVEPLHNHWSIVIMASSASLIPVTYWFYRKSKTVLEL